MRKFICGSASGARLQAGAGECGRGGFARPARDAWRYNRLELELFVPSLQLTSYAFALDCAVASGRGHGTVERASRLSSFAIFDSWPFPRRAPRHTLLRSCGPLRRGITL